jgi:hypothetical protein
MAQEVEHWGGYCPYCRKMSMFVRTVDVPNHLVHAIVTLFLCGLWLPVWIICAIAAGEQPWRCTVCGSGPAVRRRRCYFLWLR